MEGGSNATSALSIAWHTLEFLHCNPEELVDASVLPGGYGACDSYLLTMTDRSQRLLKFQPAGGEHTAALRTEAEFYTSLARRLPIKTPRIRAVRIDSGGGVGILRDCYAASPAPEDWSEDTFCRAARDLGRLHATLWGRTDELATLGFLGRRSLDVTDVSISHSFECWEYVTAQPRFAAVLSSDRHARIKAWIPTVRPAQLYLAALPQTLIHGDCCPTNVLLDDDCSMVWTNWSGASIGRGPEDLSFFYQRAEFSGGSCPWEALLIAYHDALQLELGSTVDLESIRLAAEASEWTVRLLEWPHYMDYASPETLAAFLERLDVLAERFGAPE